MFKSRKTNLDERQEMALLKIESKVCWMAFWGLLIVMAVEMIVFNNDPKTLMGEWIVFMAICFYLYGACWKAGIYDRHLKPTMKTGFIASLLGGVGLGLVFFLMILHNYPEKPMGALAAGVLAGAFTFLLCFVTMLITNRSFVKHQNKLEAEDVEDDMEM